jgi:hypothetical protein
VQYFTNRDQLELLRALRKRELANGHTEKADALLAHIRLLRSPWLGKARRKHQHHVGYRR